MITMDFTTHYVARIFDEGVDITPESWGLWPRSPAGQPAGTLDTALQTGGPVYRFERSGDEDERHWVNYRLVGLAPRE
jgi:hypothetical protein